MAQQVEHVLGKAEVTGSNPVISSILGVFLIKLSGFMAKALFFLRFQDFAPASGITAEKRDPTANAFSRRVSA